MWYLFTLGKVDNSYILRRPVLTLLRRFCEILWHSEETSTLSQKIDIVKRDFFAI